MEQREQRRLLRRELGHAVGHARRHLREVEEEGEEGHGVGRGGQQVLQQEAHLVVERHQQELEPARRRRVVAASAGQDRLPGVPAGAGGNESAAAEQRQEPVVVGIARGVGLIVMPPCRNYRVEEEGVVATVALLAVLGALVIHLLVLLGRFGCPLAVLVCDDAVLEGKHGRIRHHIGLVENGIDCKRKRGCILSVHRLHDMVVQKLGERQRSKNTWRTYPSTISVGVF